MSLLSCSNGSGSPFGIPVRPPPAPHPAPHPSFPSVDPSCCPGHCHCPGTATLLLASGSLMAHWWLAVPGCWLSAGGHRRGDSSTRTPGASWAGCWSRLQPHFCVGSETLLHSASFWVPHPDSLPRNGMGCPDPRRGAGPSVVVGTRAAPCCLQATRRRGHPGTAKPEVPITSCPPAALFPGKTLLLMSSPESAPSHAHQSPQKTPGTPVIPVCQP